MPLEVNSMNFSSLPDSVIRGALEYAVTQFKPDAQKEASA